MPKPATKSGKPRSALLWAAAGLLELPVLAVLAGLRPPVPGPLIAALHVLAAAVMFLVPPREKGWFQPTRHWGEPLALCAFLVPGLGWLAGGWLLWQRWDATVQKESYRFDQDESESANPLAALGTPQAIKRELADALDVLPAADALLSRDPALKRGAIETLARIRTSASVDWILRARTDADPEVRFYATSALTQLKRDFELSIRAAEQETVLHPGDASLRLTLERVRYEYAVSGMIDGPAREALLLECRKRAAAAAEREPGAARLAYLVERAIDPAAAFPALERLERLDPDRGTRWLRERVELLFELGRHGEVAAAMRARRAAVPGSSGDAEWDAAVRWWVHD
ncbi:MAG: HEAT repeat domain-containing protein [Elusimicrobia bacterium]|nr:HEAT repeat domain-containing protein [Elusimicrobiota bacterium]